MNSYPNIKCPICNKADTWRSENQFRPFCSDRCKLIDLGEWANETRNIPGNALDEEPSVTPPAGEDLV